MLYDENDPVKGRGLNKDLTIKSQTPDPKKPGDKKKKRPFMSGTRDEKKGDMESLSGAAKGAQMLINTLFPSDEPIPRR